jgi:putative membrane protein
MEFTYYQVLFYFIFPPTIILAMLTTHNVFLNLFVLRRRINWLPYIAILTHVLLAVVYTTPWDNYLVASNVWWYDQTLVTGWTIGYVPIEEYTFFVVQTMMTGLWVLTLWRIRALQPSSSIPRKEIRSWSLVFTASIWAASAIVLVSGWQPGRYLALILVWALIPLMMQFGFGADILWGRRTLLTLAVLPATIYLWVVDAVAISGGVWTISTFQTLGINFGQLPIEEMVFFLVTNMMISFGITLMLAPESHARISQIANWLGLVLGWKRGLVYPGAENK